MKASARKSFGEYKPVIVHEIGRTEILGQKGHVQRVVPQTKWYDGPTEIYHAERGKVFKTRDEALSYAERTIEARNAAYAQRQAEYEARQVRYAEQRATNK